MNPPVLLHDFLARRASDAPDQTALIDGETRLTYRQLHDKAHQFSRSLRAAGIAPGDRVVAMLDNSAATVIFVYGALEAGAIFVLLHGGTKHPKLRFVLDDAGAKLLLTSVYKQAQVLPALNGSKTVQHVVWTDGVPPAAAAAGPCRFHEWSAWQYSPAAADAPPAPPTPEDTAALIYTSGSTGSPKAIICPHRSMVAAAGSIVQYLENRAGDIILNCLPLAFDYGLYQVLMAAMYGGTVVLEPSFLYPARLLAVMERERVTGLPVVPSILGALLDSGLRQDRAWSSVRYITNTGAALPVPMIRAFRERFPAIRFYSMFGLSECKRVCYLPPEHIDRIPQSVGKAIPGCETAIIDEHGNPAPPGVIGDLRVRGANVMAGYWGDPELSARIFRRDPGTGEVTLHTGDRFYCDEEGFLYFAGRTDDQLKVKGERVSPLEIERALLEFPGLREAAVTGRPHPVHGVVLQAHVVCARDAAINEHDLRRHCAQRLESHMVPGRIYFLAELPRSENGKIDKRSLATMEMTDEQQPADGQQAVARN